MPRRSIYLSDETDKLLNELVQNSQARLELHMPGIDTQRQLENAHPSAAPKWTRSLIIATLVQARVRELKREGRWDKYLQRLVADCDVADY